VLRSEYENPGSHLGGNVSCRCKKHVPRVIISYRRSDTEMAAGRLIEALARRFGNEQTFRDKENISAGVDWLNEIQHAIGSGDVVLALIGPA
jgi:hypothetical protein